MVAGKKFTKKNFGNKIFFWLFENATIILSKKCRPIRKNADLFEKMPTYSTSKMLQDYKQAEEE